MKIILWRCTVYVHHWLMKLGNKVRFSIFVNEKGWVFQCQCSSCSGLLQCLWYIRAFWMISLSAAAPSGSSVSPVVFAEVVSVPDYIKRINSKIHFLGQLVSDNNKSHYSLINRQNNCWYLWNLHITTILIFIWSYINRPRPPRSSMQ